MPFPAPHSYLTILGDSYGQVEIWQTGIRLIGTARPTTGELEAIDLAIETFLSTPELSFPLGFRYIGLKWSPRTVTDRYPPGEDAIEWLRPTPFSGSASGGFPQISMVLSLRTARTRGYASNGRMYFPSARTPAPADGLITVAQANAVALAGATMIGAIRDADVGVPAVMSAVGAGLVQEVTATRVGRVMDTQRRRRNALPESYSENTAVPS